MASVGNSCFGSVFIAPFENDVFLKKIKKSPCNCFMVSNDSFKLNKVSCGIEKNPTSSRPSNSKNTIEEYNTAMKRMMRNPYEYHHDLGQSLPHLICQAFTFCSHFFVISLCFYKNQFVYGWFCVLFSFYYHFL